MDSLEDPSSLTETSPAFQKAEKSSKRSPEGWKAGCFVLRCFAGCFVLGVCSKMFCRVFCCSNFCLLGVLFLECWGVLGV